MKEFILLFSLLQNMSHISLKTSLFSLLNIKVLFDILLNQSDHSERTLLTLFYNEVSYYLNLFLICYNFIFIWTFYNIRIPNVFIINECKLQIKIFNFQKLLNILLNIFFHKFFISFITFSNIYSFFIISPTSEHNHEVLEDFFTIELYVTF